MHPVCLMSKPLLPCFVTIVLLIVSCTHGWVVTLGDMELLSRDLQNQAPVKFLKVLMVLPVFRVSTNWNSSSLLSLFDDVTVTVLLFYDILWFLLGTPGSIWRLFDLDKNCDPHQNVQSAKQLDDPVVKTGPWMHGIQTPAGRWKNGAAWWLKTCVHLT